MDKTKALLSMESVIMSIVDIQMPFEGYEVCGIGTEGFFGEYLLNGSTMTFEVAIMRDYWHLVLLGNIDYLDKDEWQHIDPATGKVTEFYAEGNDAALDRGGDLAVEYDIEPKTLALIKV